LLYLNNRQVDARKWVKAGMKYADRKMKRSIVMAGIGIGADWSVSPRPALTEEERRVKATVEFEREGAGRTGREAGW
jgi:regulation of enolase protein 1 (concanavalin A-like superfamily)